VVPIHLQELSPPAFRSSFPGICYQLGNMISAPAAQISSTISESSHIWVNGEERPNYATTQAGMMSVIFGLLMIWVALGTEQKGSRFELVKAAGLERYEGGKVMELEEEEREGEKSVERQV